MVDAGLVDELGGTRIVDLDPGMTMGVTGTTLCWTCWYCGSTMRAGAFDPGKSVTRVAGGDISGALDFDPAIRSICCVVGEAGCEPPASAEKSGGEMRPDLVLGMRIPLAYMTYAAASSTELNTANPLRADLDGFTE